jgi:regulator of sirC expression with transglutaminase-like and TPR domain
MCLKSSSSCLFACVISLGFLGVVRGAEPGDYSSTFKVDALAVLGQAMALEPRGALPPLAGDELRMLQDFRVGNLQKWNTTEVALIVAGISEEDRQQYRDQVDEITAEAWEVIKDAKTPVQKAKKLAKFLHDEPMKAGYVSGQYDLKVLLDTGHYNCVSSAVFFDMIGRRLGLKVEGVNIPHHVFCRMAGYDIEPTSGRVYPADIRDERVQKKRTEKDDDKDSLYADRLYRETSSRSLMSEPYYDEGCKFEKEKKYDRALMSFLKAATLEPGSPDTARGVNNSIKSWFKDCVTKHQTTRAAAIAKLYRQMLRDPAEANAMDKKLKGAGKSKAA